MNASNLQIAEIESELRELRRWKRTATIWLWVLAISNVETYLWLGERRGHGGFWTLHILAVVFVLGVWACRALDSLGRKWTSKPSSEHSKWFVALYWLLTVLIGLVSLGLICGWLYMAFGPLFGFGK